MVIERMETMATTAGAGQATTEQLVLDVTDLSVWYGDFQAVRDVSLPIERNRITA